MQRRRRRRAAPAGCLLALAIGLCALAVSEAAALVVFTKPLTRTGTTGDVITNRATTYRLEFTITGLSGTATIEVFMDGGAGTLYTLTTNLAFDDGVSKTFDWAFKAADYPVNFQQKYYVRVRANGAGNSDVTATCQTFAMRPAPLTLDGPSEGRLYVSSTYRVAVAVAVPLVPNAADASSPSIGIGVSTLTLHLCSRNATAPGGYVCATTLRAGVDPRWAADPTNANRYIGSVEFTVPDVPGAGLYVRATSDVDPDAVAYSSLPFDVSRDELSASLQAPGSPPALQPLASYPLSWSMTAPATVTVSFIAAGVETPLRSGLPQSGNVTVVVPFAAQGAAAATVRIAAVRSGSTVATNKDIAVSVQAATLSVLTPAPGDYLPPGQVVRVEWKTSVPGATWTISITNAGGSFSRDVATGVAGTSYSLAVPSDLGLSNGLLTLKPTEGAYRLPALSVSTTVNVGEPPIVGLTPQQKLVVIVVVVVGGGLLLIGACVGGAWWYVRDQRTKIQQAKAMGIDMGEYKGFMGTLLQGAGNMTARIGRSMRGLSTRIREGAVSMRNQAGRSMRGMKDAWAGGWTITKKKEGGPGSDAAERVAAANRADAERERAAAGRVAPAQTQMPALLKPPAVVPKATYVAAGVSIAPVAPDLPAPMFLNFGGEGAGAGAGAGAGTSSSAVTRFDV